MNEQMPTILRLKKRRSRNYVKVTPATVKKILAVFKKTGVIQRAATAAGISWATAADILTANGIVWPSTFGRALTEEQVVQIRVKRNVEQVSVYDLAKEFDVSYQTIRGVLIGRPPYHTVKP